MPLIDDDYRRIMKARSELSQSTRSTQRMDDKEGRRVAFVSGRGDKGKDTFGGLKRKKGAEAVKKERLPKGDLLNVLFAAFEETPHWSFKVCTCASL
jgi:hypothetical protein